MKPTPEMIAAACEAFSKAHAIYPSGGCKIQITDWFELEAEDAVAFGVLKSPKWSLHSDIRSDEYSDFVAAVIKEPMREALTAALSAMPAVRVKEVVPSQRLDQIIGTVDPSPTEAHDMAVELLNWRQSGQARILSAIEPAGVVTPLSVEGSPLLEWAVARWRAEVKHRPLRNVHRRSLDDVWRQVIRWAGGDPDQLVGPPHDQLLSEGNTK